MNAIVIEVIGGLDLKEDGQGSSVREVTLCN